MGIVIFKWARLFVFSVLLVVTQVTISQEHDLMLEGIDGKQHSLNEYIGKGQWVIVNVWATACPSCQRELFDLVSFHDGHYMKDAMVLGLTLDLESFGMPEKEYVANLVKALEDNPEYGELDVVYSKDDEGNGFGHVHYGPSVGVHDGEYSGDFKQFDTDPNVDPEDTCSKEDINAICIN
jgi:thiol-disulfide isomerase/thioredoxin